MLTRAVSLSSRICRTRHGIHGRRTSLAVMDAPHERKRHQFEEVGRERRTLIARANQTPKEGLPLNRT